MVSGRGLVLRDPDKIEVNGNLVWTKKNHLTATSPLRITMSESVKQPPELFCGRNCFLWSTLIHNHHTHRSSYKSFKGRNINLSEIPGNNQGKETLGSKDEKTRFTPTKSNTWAVWFKLIEMKNFNDLNLEWDLQLFSTFSPLQPANR